MLKEDIDVIFEQDPAARNYLEVILTYSGLHAIWNHRIAHAFYKKKVFFIADVFRKLVVFLQELKFIQGQKLAVAFLLTMEWGLSLEKHVKLGTM